MFSAGYILYEMLTSEQLNKGVKTAYELHAFLMNNKKKGGFEINHPALTPNWIELLKRMLAFDPTQRPDFRAIREQLKLFLAPIDKLPQVRPSSVDQVKESEGKVRRVRMLVELICARNNYLVGVLRVLHRFQQERSHLMPRVYKTVLLYLTLSRFCYLSEDGLKLIDDKEEAFVLPDSGLSFSVIEECLTLEDKVAITTFLKTVSSRINQGKEQIKLFLLGEVLSRLTEILSGPDSPERRVVEEYKLSEGMAKLRVSEYELDFYYKSNIKRCVNNLYRTAAELEVLTDQDLRIYLVALYVANIDAYVDIQKYDACTLPPAVDAILAMDRKDLEQRISAQKNKF